MIYKRVLLKLSGESLMGRSAGRTRQAESIDPEMLAMYAAEIKSVTDKKIQVAVVLGGGNIFRGLKGSEGVDRIQGDYMGMLATVINSMALQDALGKLNIKSVVMGGVPIEPVCEKMSSRKAIAYLEQGYVVIISGGTGNPFFTTDSAAALRGVEIKADVILKGTRVDGVYTADPEKDRSARKFDTLSFDEAYKKGLKIMDLTAFTLCRENRLPIVVFDVHKKGNLLKIVKGGKTGTLVS